MKEFLTDLEVVEVERFCANEVMSGAVKKVLLQHLYDQGVMRAGHAHNPLKNRAFALAQYATENPMTDELLGQHIRGLWEGVNALEAGYAELQNIKSKKEEATPSPFNVAE